MNIIYSVYSFIMRYIFKMFSFLEIMNNASIHIHIHVWTYVLILLGIIDIELVGYIITLSKVAAPFYNQPAKYDSSCFNTFLPTHFLVCLFCYNHLNMCEQVSHCSFDLTTSELKNNDRHLFLCILFSYISLEKCLIRSFVHFFKLDYLSFSY